MIGIIDYGLGNLASVLNIFDCLSEDVELCRKPSEAAKCERLLLPGVGSFRSGMELLDERGWTEELKELLEDGRPLLGICLGMQLLATTGDEHGPSQGLNLIPGHVKRLSPAPPNKVPHVGWNSLVSIKPHPVLHGIKPEVDFYFVHSYHFAAEDPADVIATCDFGGEFSAVVARGNVVGVQFHPEKSQPSGIRLLRNFIDWDGTC